MIGTTTILRTIFIQVIRKGFRWLAIAFQNGCWAISLMEILDKDGLDDKAI